MMVIRLGEHFWLRRIRRRIGAGKPTTRNGVGNREGLLQCRRMSQVVVPIQAGSDHHVHARLRVRSLPGGLLNGAPNGVDRSVAQRADNAFSVETGSLGAVDELEGQLRQGAGQRRADEQGVCTDDDLGQVVEWIVADDSFPVPQGVIDGGDGEIRQ